MSSLWNSFCKFICRPETHKTSKEEIEKIAEVPHELKEATHKMNNATAELQSSARLAHKEIDKLTNAFKMLSNTLEKNRRGRGDAR